MYQYLLRHGDVLIALVVDGCLSLSATAAAVERLLEDVDEVEQQEVLLAGGGAALMQDVGQFLHT